MKTLLRLLALLAPFRWLIALAILLGCAMIASNMLLLGMSAYLIAEAALVPLMVMLTLPTFIVRLVSVTRASARYAERLVAHNVTFRLLARLRSRVYQRLEPLAPAYLQRVHSGDIHTRLLADIEELQNLYLRAVSPIIVALAISVLTFWIFTIFSPFLAWTALAFLSATGVGVPALTALLTRNLGQQELTLRAELKTQQVDSLQGVQDLLAYGQAGSQLNKIGELDARIGRVQRRVAVIGGLQLALNDLMANLALWTIVMLAIPLITNRTINGVYLGFLALLMLAAFEGVLPLGQAFQSLGNSLAAGTRIFEIIDMQPVVQAPAQPLPAPAGHELTFEHVSFTYHPGEAEALHDITLSLSPGRRIALVGASGAGKSTLARLAVRFWDPTEGTIRLDGQDLRRYALADLRARISMVDQETYLFNDTLRGNLLLGKPGADPQEIQLALDQARLGEFVSRLPQGLDTWIGEQGLRLSGGERQRVAIARALLKDAPLLILDEVTANLDPRTERELWQALDRLMQGHATLVITHRLLAMEQMDEIIVLDHGHIIERGTHASLLAMAGSYRALWEAQRGMLSLV